MSGGHENLVPLKDRPSEEQRRIRTAGGKASGAARRRNRALKDCAAALMETKAPSDQAAILSRYGFSEDENCQLVLVLSMYDRACGGDVKAAQWLSGLTEEDPSYVLRSAELKLKRETLEHQKEIDTKQYGAAQDTLNRLDEVLDTMAPEIF